MPGSKTSGFEPTVTTTIATPCPSSVLNQTSTTSSTGSSSQTLNLATLFGNFSEMTVAISGSGSPVSSIATSSFDILNVSSSQDYGQIYEVNLTTKTVDFNVQVQESQNLTTTIVQPGNHTTVQTGIFLVSSNGTVISVNGVGGVQASRESLGAFLFFFQIFSDNVNSIPSNQLSVINTTKVTIGHTTMDVTNYKHSSMVNVEILQSCAGFARHQQYRNNFELDIAGR